MQKVRARAYREAQVSTERREGTACGPLTPTCRAACLVTERRPRLFCFERRHNLFRCTATGNRTGRGDKGRSIEEMCKNVLSFNGGFILVIDYVRMQVTLHVKAIR